MKRCLLRCLLANVGATTMSDALRFKCRRCRDKTGPAAFKDVDLEFNSARPLCPDCQDAADLEGATCEFCEAPASASTASGPLCGEHFDRYVAGYQIRD